MEELTVLQDSVPPFPDEEAFAIMEQQLGRPLGEVFSSISEVTCAPLLSLAFSRRPPSRGPLHLLPSDCCFLSFQASTPLLRSSRPSPATAVVPVAQHPQMLYIDPTTSLVPVTPP